MSKLAVIFFLFAMCAVAMSARIAREEPTKKPFEQLQDQLSNALNSIQEALKSPELQSNIDNFAKQFRETAKSLSDKVQAQISEASNAKV